MTLHILINALNSRDKNTQTIDLSFDSMKKEFETAERFKVYLENYIGSAFAPNNEKYNLFIEAAAIKRFDIIDYLLPHISLPAFKKLLIPTSCQAILSPASFLSLEDLITLTEKLRIALNYKPEDMFRACLTVTSVATENRERIDYMNYLLDNLNNLESKPDAQNKHDFINLQEDAEKNSLLHFATQAKNPKTIKWLLDKKSNVNAFNNDAESPLSKCQAHDNIICLEILLNHPQANISLTTLYHALTTMINANKPDHVKAIVNKIGVANYKLSDFMTDKLWEEVINNSRVEVLKPLVFGPDEENIEHHERLTEELSKITIPYDYYTNKYQPPIAIYADIIANKKNSKDSKDSYAIVDVILEGSAELPFCDSDGYYLGVRGVHTRTPSLAPSDHARWKIQNIQSNNFHLQALRDIKNNPLRTNINTIEMKSNNPQPAIIENIILAKTLDNTLNEFIAYLGTLGTPPNKTLLKFIRLCFSTEEAKDDISEDNIIGKDKIPAICLYDLHKCLNNLILFSKKADESHSQNILNTITKLISLLNQANMQEVFIEKPTPLTQVLSSPRTKNDAKIVAELLKIAPFFQINELSEKLKSCLKPEDQKQDQADFFDLVFYIKDRDKKTSDAYMKRLAAIRLILTHLIIDNNKDAVYKDLDLYAESLYSQLSATFLGSKENATKILKGIKTRFPIKDNEKFEQQKSIFLNYLLSHASNSFYQDITNKYIEIQKNIEIQKQRSFINDVR